MIYLLRGEYTFAWKRLHVVCYVHVVPSVSPHQHWSFMSIAADQFGIWNGLSDDVGRSGTSMMPI